MTNTRNQGQSDSCCSCGCGVTSKKKVVVEYLYLDIETCGRCIGTDNILDEVMMTLTPTLNIAGFEVEYNGQTYEVPPKEMIAKAIMNEVFGYTEAGYSCEKYEFPENLREFFEGKKNKSDCSCGGNYC